jgi:hypothetical protein
MEELKFISIEIKLEQETALAILLHEDGTINRKGNGTDKIDQPLAIGMTNTLAIFKNLNPFLNNEFENYLNRVYDDPEKKGRTCSIEIKISTKDRTTGTKFIYGIESMFPPKEIGDFIEGAIELTNPWYDQAIKTKTATSSD